MIDNFDPNIPIKKWSCYQNKNRAVTGPILKHSLVLFQLRHRVTSSIKSHRMIGETLKLNGVYSLVLYLSVEI